MIPLSKFADLLKTFQAQANEDWEEIIMAASLLGDRPNFFTMDDNGLFHAQASGTLDECIRALTHHLAKLNKIKENQNGTKA